VPLTAVVACCEPAETVTPDSPDPFNVIVPDIEYVTCVAVKSIPLAFPGPTLTE